MRLGSDSDNFPSSRRSLVRHEHLPLTVVLLLLRLRPPSERAGPQAAPPVAAQLGVVQKVPHEPDLRNGEAVDHHQLFVEAGVERLEVRRRGRPRDPKGPKALVAIRFDADQLEAHSQEDVIDREQLHLETFPVLPWLHAPNGMQDKDGTF